jgi:VanZ family protein
MSRTEKGKRVIVTIVSAILLSLLYVMIWGFSAQDGAESGGLSHAISEKVTDLLDAISRGDFTEEYREGLAAWLEHPIRKMAHFAEYAVMGVLMFGIWRPWIKMNKKTAILTIAAVCFSASVDELHQFFVPDRYPSVADVLLDTCGGATGLFVVHRITLAFQNRFSPGD